MKIVQVTTSGNGGARTSCETLNKNLNLVYESEIVNRDYRDLDSWQRIASKTITFYESLRTRKDYGLFSTHSLSQINFDKLITNDPDIIHIHNWFNFLSIEDIDKITSNYRTVFTLHDQRIFTGGCHISNDCQKFVEDCTNCPGVAFNRKSVQNNRMKLNRILEKNNKNIGYIFPSMWLRNTTLGLISNSTSYFNRVIPNFIKEFPGMSKFKNKSDKIENIYFIAANIDVPLKGLDKLIVKLEDYNEKIKPDRINLYVIGKGKERKSNKIRIECLGEQNVDSMISHLQFADLIIIASHVENHPGVALEAMKIGIPVVATNVGGIPEIIEDSVNGFLINKDLSNIDKVLDKVRKMKRYELDQIIFNAKQYIENNHSERNIISKYVEFYEALMENSKVRTC